MTEKTFYTRGKWRDFDRFECDLCNYDTLDGEEAMTEHLATIHFPPAPPPPPPTIPIETRFGRVIEPSGAATEILETEEELLSEGIDLSGLSADDIMELVEKGQLDAELVIKEEQSGKARKGLLRRLGVKE